ncbi:MAG: anti-sigma factor family protein [Acidobacteriota bacterium]
MSCQGASRLSAYLDGELSPSENAAVDGHLGECATCREELAEFRRLSETLRTVTEADPAFVARFRSRRDSEIGAFGTAWERLAVRLLPLAAVALLAAGAAVWFSSDEERLSDLEARELGNGLTLVSEEATLHDPVLQIALEPFPRGEP